MQDNKKDNRIYAEMLISLVTTRSQIKDGLSLNLSLSLQQWQNLADALNKLRQLEMIVANHAGRQELQEVQKIS